VTSGFVCAQNGTACNCVSARACESCTTDADCLVGHCDSTNGICDVNNCADGGVEACAATGYSCSNNSCNCLIGPVCGGCSANTDCASGQCDVASGVCVDGKDCTKTGGCAYQGGTCQADGGCVCF
jgi:hypothetical protein